MDDYLSKPINRDELAGVLARYLDPARPLDPAAGSSLDPVADQAAEPEGR